MLLSIFEFRENRERNHIPGDELLLLLVVCVLILTFADGRVDRKTNVSELNDSKNWFFLWIVYRIKLNIC
jgi:hypothetical protein